MCGIAGMVRLGPGKTLPPDILTTMTDILTHRGPDESGFHRRDQVSFGARRLSIVGLDNGSQPVANESDEIHAVFNGEIYDHPEQREWLAQRGHRLRKECDTELLPHYWEEFGPDMFERLRGQFAIALHDETRNQVILARDRFGICPLYWTICDTGFGRYLLFGSEIKALLASGLVEIEPDLHGIDQTFTFFALPGPVTCFQGVRILKPGHFLRIALQGGSSVGQVDEIAYWRPEFPDQGEEEPCDARTIDRFQDLFRTAVSRRLRADVPVVAYLSGGIDSSLVLASAAEIRGQAPPSFTLRIQSPGLDEGEKAREVAEHVGAQPVSIPVGTAEILDTYPRLIEAAECPVSDTVCAALLLLAQDVHRRGYKVALTGEGSDELMAGYPWFKIHRLMAPLDKLGYAAGYLARRAALQVAGLPRNDRGYDRRVYDATGGGNAWLEVYGMVSAGKARVYGPRMKPLLNRYVAYDDLDLDLARMRAWHPLNRSLYLGQRIHLSGLLLSIAGDRVAMHSSVETRYPFLDEDLVDFVQRLDPAWKLRRLQDKYLLRKAAGALVPPHIAWRPKKMFRAPWDVLDPHETGTYLAPLLSRESLKATGYFDAESVESHRAALPRIKGVRKTLLEQTLASVVMTQLWHHIFISDLGAPVKRIAFGRRQLS